MEIQGCFSVLFNFVLFYFFTTHCPRIFDKQHNTYKQVTVNHFTWFSFFGCCNLYSLPYGCLFSLIAFYEGPYQKLSEKYSKLCPLGQLCLQFY